MTNDDGLGLAGRMAELAQELAVPKSLDGILHSVTGSVLELVPGAELAGVLLVGANRTHESLGPTDDLMHQLDQIQIDTGQGPCLDATVDEHIVRVDDFTTADRWPAYTPKVTELGVRSSLSFKLFTAERTAGALNAFSTRAHAFDAESEAIGSVLAAHAAAAIVANRQGEQLESALSSRDLIGQAKGIIMERFNVDAVRAFELMRELSQSGNVKIVDIAQRIVDTRGT
ncbi:GAF domain-containing protein [Mycolicibacterium iranicum]|uniref:GAF domain-containing protein n=1 Tax=Mycolicibacterium iranicum TaxID=912594 RepID=A0A839Q656_MYCIR|nr:GAF and ANTAR domain-containing protein [Mycolicibacterium iranicum]MBB2991429.1 GAF domain-containing protein [Mycolicibacterium iranicum]